MILELIASIAWRQEPIWMFGKQVMQPRLTALYGNPDQVRAATLEMMDQFKGSRHIANLGHGLYPDIDPEMVKVFIQTVKEY